MFEWIKTLRCSKTVSSETDEKPESGDVSEMKMSTSKISILKTGGKTTIEVDGKKVDPESDEGRKALKKASATHAGMEKMSARMQRHCSLMEQSFKEMTEIFENVFDENVFGKNEDSETEKTDGKKGNL